MAIAGHPIRESEGITNVWRLLEGAVNFVGSDNPEAGHILVRLGMAVGVEKGDLEQARDAFDKALTIARKTNDISLEAEALASSADVFVRFNLHEEGLSCGLKAVELATQENAPFVEGVARRAILMVAFYRGDVELYQQHIDPLLSTAEKIRNRFLIDMGYYFKTCSLDLLGEWEAARGSSNKLLADSPNEPTILAQRALTEYSTGNFEIGDRYITRLIEIMDNTPPSSSLEYLMPSVALPIISLIADSTEYLAQGKLAAEAVVQHYVTKQRFLTAHVGLGITAVLEKNERAASESYDTLIHFEVRLANFSISLDRVLGLLAHTMGSLDDSKTHFEDALAFCRKAGYRPELAWSLCDYADMLLERKADIDKDKAVAMLDESLAISTELGMRPLMERVLSRREILKA